ncbi:hypothetical protein B0O80DRAFT_42660 [Mortierella sp. GBAus27b]|nr:hypothetical protein B0O80DRAFT_42660 [Mortierella sp. GBAus27b]
MVPQSTPSPPLTTTFQPISIPTASGIPAGLGQALSPGSVPTSGNTGSVNGGVMGNAARPQSRSPSSRSTPPPSPPLSVTAEVRLPKKVLPSTIANGIQHASDEEERIQSPSMVTQEETGSVGDSQNIRGTVQFRHRKSSTSPQSGPSGGSDTAAEAKDGSTVYTSQELDIAYSMVISTQPQGKSRSQRQRQVHDTRSFQGNKHFLRDVHGVGKHGSALWVLFNMHDMCHMFVWHPLVVVAHR